MEYDKSAKTAKGLLPADSCFIYLHYSIIQLTIFIGIILKVRKIERGNYKWRLMKLELKYLLEAQV